MKPPRPQFVVNPNAPDVRAIADLLTAAGMGPRDSRAMRRAIQHSSIVVCVYDGPRLIAFGRVVGDQVYYATIWDVVVAPDWQRRGIGRRTIELLIRRCRKRTLRMIGLFTNPHNRQFYERLGFTWLDQVHGMRLYTDGAGRP